MKILLVGSNTNSAIERHYIKYLKALGADIYLYSAPDIIFSYHSKTIINKILYKTKINTNYKPVNRELVKIAFDYKPDVIWIFKGMEIFPETLVHLGKYFKLANYNPDHPFIISGPGSGNDNVTKSVGLYHLHFCYQTGLQQKIEEQYGIPTVLLPFGFELSNNDFDSTMNDQEINKTCFIGNPDKIRIRTLKHIAESGYMVDVYGHGWDKTTLKYHKNVKINGAIYGTDYWNKLRQYRIQLNIFRKHNIGSHNMRTFEIPAVGGIQLAPYSIEQSEFFKEVSEIIFYINNESLLEKIKNTLSLKVEEANVLRKNARSRSQDSGYKYEDRALTVYNTFKSMMKW